MNFIITLLLLLLILNIIIAIHEFGHFLLAKKNGVYVDEFSLGMGPQIWKFKPKKSETTYSIRLFLVGGYVSMAEKSSPELKLKKNQVLDNKTTLQKLSVLIMGIVMNFALAIVLFFISGLLYGRPIDDPSIGLVADKTPAYNAGLEAGDKILKINGTKISNWDDIIIEISGKKLEKNYKFVVEKSDGSIKEYDVVPVVTEVDGTEKRTFGIGSNEVKYEKGFVAGLKYGIQGTIDNTKTIFKVLVSLVTGKVSVSNLSGPVGIYSIVDQLKSSGLQAILYLTAYLSINVAVINLIPIPVFDGGRILLVLIEAIRKKKSSEKLEMALNYIGFGLMILLMLYVTINDIIKLIK